MFYKIGTINENKLQKRTHWKFRSWIVQMQNGKFTREAQL